MEHEMGTPQDTFHMDRHSAIDAEWQRQLPPVTTSTSDQPPMPPSHNHMDGSTAWWKK